MDDLYWLDQLHQHRDWVGDKAFYLALLKQRGYSVRPGFVIPASTLQRFLVTVNWQEQLFADLPHSSIYLDTENPRQLQQIAREIQQAFADTSLPPALLDRVEAAIESWQTGAVILRPSLGLLSGLDPTVSTRTNGLLSSRICPLDSSASLALLLKSAWAELFSAKSLFYWQRFGVQLQQVRLALLVQPIQSSLAAGTVQISNGQVQVQSTWGLGQTLALGGNDQFWGDLHQGTWSTQTGQKLYAYRLSGPTSTPDPESSALQSVLTAWIPEPELGLQLEMVPPQQQLQPSLSSAQLQQLGDLAQQIEAVVGLPLRLDWALEPELGLHITQVLPRFEPQPSPLSDLEPGLPAGSTSPAPKPLPAPAYSAAPHAFTPHRAGETDVHLVEPSSEPAFQVLVGLAAAPGRIVAPAWVLDTATGTTVPSGTILVAPVVTPQMVQVHQVAGIVTEQGGMTSHAAILARELGIPAVVGVSQATQLIRTGDTLALDGELGQVYCSTAPSLQQPEWPFDIATPTQEPPVQNPSAQEHRLSPELIAGPPREAKPQLWVSLSQLSTLAQVSTLPVDGLGLLRSELMLLDLFGQQHPLTWLHQSPEAVIGAQIAARVLPFATAFAPRRVFYRALDLPPEGNFARLNSSTNSSTASEALEPPVNGVSMLGVRGSLGFQLYPELLQVQLLALRQLQQQGLTNLSLVLPFVRTVEEFCFCRQQVEQAGLYESPQFQLWIMAEVPSVLLLLPDYAAAGVEGIAIGLNDLTQLLLGVDRDQPQMAAAFDPSHLAVQRAIQQLIQTATQLNLPCSVCGQGFQQRPQLLANLLDWGVTAVSVEPREVDWVRRVLEGGEVG
ncbi:MAG: putative PEP-binding protein [Elainella sp.]